MYAVGAAASIAGAYVYIQLYTLIMLLYICCVYRVCISIKSIYVRTTKLINTVLK